MAERLEAFLAGLYVDGEACRRFLDDPRGEGARAGLSEAEIMSLETMDRDGLRFASASFGAKRVKNPHAVRPRGWRHVLRRLFG